MYEFFRTFLAIVGVLSVLGWTLYRFLAIDVYPAYTHTRRGYRARVSWLRPSCAHAPYYGEVFLGEGLSQGCNWPVSGSFDEDEGHPLDIRIPLRARMALFVLRAVGY